MYLIDKVVRQRAKAGPIGVDNSEFINIEMEEEYKERNQYIEHLVNGKQANNESLSNEDKENMQNERLMQRLTAAANLSNNKSKMTSVMGKSAVGDRSANAYNHEEWVRRKEHEAKLKE